MSGSGFRKKFLSFADESPLKMMKMHFISFKKLFLIVRYFCSAFFGYVGKRLDKWAKFNFKSYANWETNIYDTYIFQNLWKKMKSDNEI